MKFISTKTHGILDYVMGIALLALPFLLNFDASAIESIILFVCGALMLLMAVITQYELGIARILPVPLHLIMDILSGAFLALSPMIFGFSDRVFFLFVVLGVFEVVVSFFTNTVAGPPYKGM